MTDFIHAPSKKSLLAMLKKAKEITPSLFRNFVDGVLFKTEIAAPSGASLIGVPVLGDPTYDNVQDYINQLGDRSQITGLTFSDNGDGTIAVAAGTAFTNVSDSINSEMRFLDFAGDTSVALTDGATNYIYLDYAAGTPAIVVDVTGADFYSYDHIILGCVFRHGDHSHWIESLESGMDTAHRAKMHFFEDEGYHRTSGLVTTGAGTRNLVITAGVIWTGLCRGTTLSFNTILTETDSGTADATEANMLHDADGGFDANDVGKTVKNTTDTTYTRVITLIDSGQLELEDDIFVSGETYDMYDAWKYWYNTDGGTTWTHTDHVRTISNTQYNKQTAAFGLQSLTANRYGVHWVFIDASGQHIQVVYGQGDYTAAQAINAAIPATLPPIVVGFGILLAKIICQEGTDVMTISYPWADVFSTSLATDHGSLAGLADDDHPQYLPVAITVQNDTGSSMSARDLCYISGDAAGIPNVILADADAAATATKMLVVINETIADSATGDAIAHGKVTGFTGLTPSAIQYVHTTAGDFVEAAPSGTADIVRVAGYALSATVMYFNPGGSWVEIA